MDIIPGRISPSHAVKAEGGKFDAFHFLSTSIEPICVLDLEGRFVWTNTAYLACLDYKAEELIGKSLLDFVDSQDFLMTLWEIERMLKGGHTSIAFVHRCRKKNGNTIFLQWNANPQLEEKRIYITYRDISRNREKEFAKKRIIENYNLIIRAMDAGVWTHDFQNGEEWWSDNFYKVLHYKPREFSASFENFIKLLHPEDLEHVKERFHAHINGQKIYLVEMRLLNALGEYQWVESTCQSIRDENGQALRVAGIMRDIHESKQVQIQLERQEFLLNETAQMVKLGSWELDLKHMKPLWSEEVYHIHEVDVDYPLTIESALNFYLEEFRKPLQDAVDKAIFQGKSYDLELKIRTGTGRSIWVRTIGKPVYNKKREIIGIRGTIQDIHKAKLREVSLNKSIDIISEQNNRLSNFAYIISHNIRSHISNFELLYDLYDRTDDEAEIEKIAEMGKLTFDRLKETIDHLSQVIEIQSDIHQQMEVLDIRKILMRTFDILGMDIKQTNTLIDLDISSWYEMKGVMAYVESIFLNLISNAIKYRHPERTPHLRIKTYMEEDRLIMTFQDNGLGIDMERNAEALFGMYKTFHDHPQAKGIGLFICKNQVEAMGGNIKVNSKLKQGTTFTLSFRKYE